MRKRSSYDEYYEEHKDDESSFSLNFFKELAAGCEDCDRLDEDYPYCKEDCEKYEDIW